MDSNQIEDFRRSIDNLDGGMIYLLAERLRVTVKLESCCNREELLSSRNKLIEEGRISLSQLAVENSLSNDFFSRFFDIVDQESRNLNTDEDQRDNWSFFPIATLETIDFSDFKHSLQNVDLAIANIVFERFRVVEKVGYYKQQKNMQALAAKRWKEVLDSKSKMAAAIGLRASFVCDILNLIHEEALRIEKKIIR